MILRSYLPTRSAMLLMRAAAAFLAAIGPSNAAAKVPELTVTPQAELRFGSIIVFGSGSRTVSANGSVIDSGIISGNQHDGAPAQFTVSYDRGNESRRPLDLEIEVSLSEVPPINRNGTSARIVSFESDIPGAMHLQPGLPFIIRIPDCRDRICSRSFAVGGRLDVTRNFGGTELRFPLVMHAVVVSMR